MYCLIRATKSTSVDVQNKLEMRNANVRLWTVRWRFAEANLRTFSHAAGPKLRFARLQFAREPLK